jgi:hypothetical protein
MTQLREIAARFPEDLYPPALATNKQDYLKRVLRGYKILSKSRVNIIGLARDLGGNCPLMIARVSKIASLCRDYRVYIYENDSADNTPDRLIRQAKKDSKWVVLSEKTGSKKWGPVRESDRTLAMADCRNKLMDLITTRDFDYTIIIDTDLDGGYSYDGLAHTFSFANWHFIGANGLIYKSNAEGKIRRLYYDSWAFRHINVISAHSDHDINLLQLNRGEPLLKVDSCFGGIGVYRNDAYFSGVRYGHINVLGEAECEHVILHQRMKRAGYNDIYMNPSMIALYSKSQFSLI